MDISFGEWLIIVGIIVPLVVAVVYLAIDMLRRWDLSGWAKVAWLAFFVVLPVVAAVVYLMTRPAQPIDVQHEIDLLDHEEEVEARHELEAQVRRQAELREAAEAEARQRADAEPGGQVGADGG